MSRARQAVVQGTTDTEYDAAFPASVKLLEKGASGTLVSPYWVLSAEHAFDEAGEVDANWSWHVGTFPNGSPTGDPLWNRRVFWHSKEKSGPVRMMGLSSHRETDLALVRLNRPVRHPIGQPARLPAYANECGVSSFLGRLVGFADAGYNENGYEAICSNEVSSPRRRFAPTVVAWERFTYLGPGSSHQHRFEAGPGDGCTGMAGVGVGGDSGGSLYRWDDLFCGVISGDGPFASGGSPDGTVWSQYHTAAVDSQDAIEFWSQYVLDVDGLPESPCPPVDSYNDADGDGIPASCDSCPTVYNPEQLTEVDDEDLDGLGDACDLCDWAVDPVDQLGNRNREIEFAVAYPNAERVPVLDRDDFASDAAFQLAVDDYRAAFFPDTCDPMPVPAAVLKSGGGLPQAPPSDPLDPTCQLYTQGCSSHFNNLVELQVFSSTTINAVIQQNGPIDATVGLRWCDCQAVQGGTPASFEGRTACRRDFTSNCRFDEDLYDSTGPSNRWLAVRTKDLNQPWSAAQVGDEWPLEVGSETRSVVWDYTALGAQYLDSSTNFQSVNGILWAHTTELSATVPEIDGDGRPLVRFANSLNSGAASWGYYPEGHLWVAINDWIVCPMCGIDGVAQPLHEAGNPHWVTTFPGAYAPALSPDPATRDYYSQVALERAIHVGASEPLVWLERAMGGAKRFTRGVGVDRNSGRVSGKVLTQGLDALPVYDDFDPGGGPVLAGDEGLAFSAIEQRLYVLGGSGESEGAGWLLDLEGTTAGWRHFSMPDGEKVSRVYTAVYRHEDRSVYFLDGGSPLRLRRWNAQRTLRAGVLQTIAELPESWDGFGAYALIAGPRGELGLVAYRGSGASASKIGVLHADEEGTFELVKITSPATDLIGPPMIAPLGIVYTTDSAKGARLPFGEMDPPDGAELPTFYPH
ncbi:MAG: trypsin-like serine protease [Polyangiaceae bacterium]|nr:trypsin-like serine protease [Polyangiaceae bacterium]